jgi:hypothetical protein
MKNLKWVFLGMLVLGLCAAGQTRADWSPADCQSNELDLSLARSQLYARIGDTVYFTVEISNCCFPTGCDINDTEVTLTLPALDGTPTGDVNVLDTGAIFLISGANDTTYAPVEWVVAVNPGITLAEARADANGQLRDRNVGFGEAKDTKTIAIEIIDPNIELTKTADPCQICGQETLVTYTYRLTNTGDVDVCDVVVVDQNCTPEWQGADPGDGDDLLEVGETWVYMCTDMISETTINRATADGNDVLLSSPVHAEAEAEVVAESPDCEIFGDTEPDCDTSGNILFVTASGGIPPYGYSWSRTGDLNWTIDTGADTNAITYTAGPPDTTALFRVDINDAYDCNTVCRVELSCGPPPGDTFCSLTQGFWGNAGGTFDGNSTPDLIGELLAAHGGDLTVGGGNRSIIFDSNDCIILRLPAGGRASKLPNFGQQNCDSLPNSILKKKNDRISNVLVGQVVALTLNVWLDTELGPLELPEGDFCTEGEPNDVQCFSSISEDVLDAIDPNTVDELLDLANAALNGDLSPGDISAINYAVSTINEAFDECRTIVACREVCCDGVDNDCDNEVDEGCICP